MLGFPLSFHMPAHAQQYRSEVHGDSDAPHTHVLFLKAKPSRKAVLGQKVSPQTNAF